MVRIPLVLCLMAGCSGVKPGVHGSLLREGEVVKLDAAKLEIEATRCREPHLSLVTVTVGLGDTSDPLIRVQGNWKKVIRGTKITPRTVDHLLPVPPVDLAAWVSVSDRIPEYHLPKSGWVRFRNLWANGPIDVDFVADFGDQGKVSGSLHISSTKEEVCEMP